MTIGGPPADAGSPAMWTTGYSNNILFMVAPLTIRASGLLTVSNGGQLDLGGGSCRIFSANNLNAIGSVVGGTCTTDGTLTGSIDAWVSARYFAQIDRVEGPRQLRLLPTQ